MYKFEYAIENECGAFYDGSVRDDCWTRNRQDIFTYTEAGAHKKVDNFPVFFADCKVTRLP